MSSTPFDPLWKYILDEGSDEEHYDKKRWTRKYRGGETKSRDGEKDDGKKVKFTLPLPRNHTDDDDSIDDISLIELVSMEIAPKKTKAPEKPSILRKSSSRSSKDARDDDDSWSILNSSFVEEEKEPTPSRLGLLRKSKKPEKLDENSSGNSLLSLFAVSQSFSETSIGSRNVKKASSDASISAARSRSPGRRLSLGRKRDDKKAEDGETKDGDEKNSILKSISFRRSERSPSRIRDKTAPIFTASEDEHEENADTGGNTFSSFLPLSLLSGSRSFGGGTPAAKSQPPKQSESIFPDDEDKGGDTFTSFLPSSLLVSPQPGHKSVSKSVLNAQPESKSKSKSQTKKEAKSKDKRKSKIDNDDGGSLSSFLPSSLLSSPESNRKRQPKKATKTKDSRKSCISRGKANESQDNESQGSSSVSKSFGAAGVVAVGIAAAGAVATSELFDSPAQPKNGKPNKEQADDPSRNKHKFWDIFSPSSDEDSDGGSASDHTSSSNGIPTDASAATDGTHSTVDQISSRSQFRNLLQDNDDESEADRANMTDTPARGPPTEGPASIQDASDSARHLLKNDDDYSMLDKVEADIPEKRGIGRIVCCSVKNLNDRQAFFDQQESRGDESEPREYVRPDVSVFQGVKMVADEDGRNIVVGNGKVQHWHDSHKVFSQDAIVSRKGPQSLYTYEYDSTTYMGAQYESFGSEARKVITVHDEAPFSITTRSTGEVTVKIEASTVSYTDCRIRKGEGRSPLSLPITPGIDLVGKIDGIDKRTSSRFGLRNGDTVMALVKQGGNARYAQINAEQLVKVPDGLEATDVACIAEAYLSAFQAVHCGQRLITRYKKNSLSGKSILILGALTNTGRAAVELANAAGATLIYSPCKEKHRERVRAMGSTPIGINKEEWMPLVHKKLDLIIDATIELTGKEENYFDALNEKGHYLFIGRTQIGVDKIVTKWTGAAKLACSSNRVRLASQIHSYDVFEKWESNIESCKRDLSHLLKLLQKKDIAPKILDRVPLYKVAKAQQVLDQKRLQGFLVCEPWIKSMS
eukprot:CAMPEP_0119026600 /NCGR_PEP_ID=MMETSP1176-20130426/35742_1 /TAXON_ID=265551 /ORGANISM="Synedropsis recta cf, Strain CCMP1620" /LENGTH=1036 /DNA_ID=CAMNT_0006982347 /DNA_START=8 /DNA_END=3115 /DNA_ORIENTATION=+